MEWILTPSLKCKLQLVGEIVLSGLLGSGDLSLQALVKGKQVKVWMSG